MRTCTSIASWFASYGSTVFRCSNTVAAEPILEVWASPSASGDVPGMGAGGVAVTVTAVSEGGITLRSLDSVRWSTIYPKACRSVAFSSQVSEQKPPSSRGMCRQ